MRCVICGASLVAYDGAHWMDARGLFHGADGHEHRTEFE